VFRLAFRFWKGARIAIFSCGSEGGSTDFDWVRYTYGATTEALGFGAIPVKPARPIDRRALVSRHNPRLSQLDPDAPLTVGKGGFAFTADIMGFQTFDGYYRSRGIPVERGLRRLP
jgi:hypothetical protein